MFVSLEHGTHKGFFFFFRKNVIGGKDYTFRYRCRLKVMVLPQYGAFELESVEWVPKCTYCLHGGKVTIIHNMCYLCFARVVKILQFGGQSVWQATKNM